MVLRFIGGAKQRLRARLYDKKIEYIASLGSEPKLLEPEARPLTSLTSEEIAESADRFGVFDTRSGLDMSELIRSASGRCKRLVIDCTESDSLSGISERICIEHAESVIMGAKIILHAVGATRAVFAFSKSQKEGFFAVSALARDKKLFSLERLEEKYPYNDHTLMDALFVADIAKDGSPIDRHVLIISAESAKAIFEAMANGKPMTERSLSVCGDGIEGRNVTVPLGTPISELLEYLGIDCKDKTFIKNSLLCGEVAEGVIDRSTRALIRAKKSKKNTKDCIFCGKCASVCPMRLMPYRTVSGSYSDRKHCISCGACEYVCPSEIPLVSMMREGAKK